MPDTYKNWIGREDVRTDTIDRDRLRRLDALMDRPHDKNARNIPPLSHWLCFLPETPQSGLGPDGHPNKGGFLPPIDLPRRMWAGGRLDLIAPIQIGEDITRRSRILDVREKTGTSGALAFVTVEHEILSRGTLCIREEQDIVFREASTGPAPLPPGETRPPENQTTITPTPTLLFRYSALTFNAHRIHYDRDYATNVEHYPALVVHGPLIATLLADTATRTHKAELQRFEFRARRPVFDDAPFTLNVANLQGRTAETWASDSDGFTAMTATATFAA